MSDAFEPIIIAPDGDLILDVRQEEGSTQFSYRVDSNTLHYNSQYFEHLLSDRFSEGQKVSAALEALKIAGNSSFADVAASALPRLPVVNVGRISKVSSIHNLMADFFRALHGHDLPSHPPVANLANLAVVADRFDALPHLAKYVQRKKYLQTVDAKWKAKNTSMPEERVRQKLLIGLLFDHPLWVFRYSKCLVLRDSQQWKIGAEGDDAAALWWDMPKGVEEEMMLRREYLLETINSLQAHFLKLYTGERQCKLGYDSSPQCDSFQLGEMIRFFTRVGTLRLQGTIYDSTEPTHYQGDIDRLIESLRQCSSYQIDRNHAHCGLRVRLIPLLDLLQAQLRVDSDIGICLDCWSNQRPAYAWSLAKRPVLWTKCMFLTGSTSLASSCATKGRPLTPSVCLAQHTRVRDMLMAVERNWTIY